METKNLDAFVTDELRFLNYDAFHLVSPHSPGGGGLALLWTNDVHVSVVSTSHNVIDTIIKFKGQEFLASFVYGEPDISCRPHFSNSLSSTFADRDRPWIVTGDLNEITDNSKKSGGPQRPESSFSKLPKLPSANRFV